MQATGGKADPAPGDAEDIAKLLRALNEDLDRNERQGRSDSDDDEDEATGSESWFPFGKIALALVAAGAIGFGIVMLDSDSPAEPETMSASVTAATGTPQAGPVTTVVGTPQQVQARPPAPPASPAPTPNPTPVPARATIAPPAPAPMPAQTAQGGGSQTEIRPITELMLRAPEPPPAAISAPTATVPSLRVPEPPAPLSPSPGAAVPGTTVTVTRLADDTGSGAAPGSISDEEMAVQSPERPEAVATVTTPVVMAPPVPSPSGTAQLQAMLSPSATSPPLENLDEAEAGLPDEPEETDRRTTTALAAPALPATSAPARTTPTEPTRQPPVSRPAPPRTAAPAVAPRAPAATSGRFVIQVGTFKVRENAVGLAGRLKSSGYQASTIDWTDQSGTRWHAVRVGGYPSEGSARQAAEQVRSRFGLPAVVIRR